MPTSKKHFLLFGIEFWEELKKTFPTILEYHSYSYLYDLMRRVARYIAQNDVTSTSFSWMMMSLFFIFCHVNISYAQNENNDTEMVYNTTQHQQKEVLKNNNTPTESEHKMTDFHLDYTFPKENKVVFCKDILLSWTTNLPTVRLQISTDKSFENPLIDTIVSTQHILIPALAKHSTYYWMVGPVSKNITVAEVSTFFKTTSILMDESVDTESIEIIPTWIEETALLYIDNPDGIKYQLSVINQNNEVVAQKSTKLERFALETESWPKGHYQLKLKMANHTEKTKSFAIR